MSFVAFQF